MTDPFAKLHPVVADLIRRGMANARSGRTAYARREFEQALALDPDCHEALLWLAALAPDGQASLRYLSRALELNPRDPRAHAGIRWARKRIKTPSRGDEITQPSSSLASRLAQQTHPSPRLDRGSADIDDRPRREFSRWRWALAAIVSASVILAGGIVLIDVIGTGHASAEAEPTLAVAQITPTAISTDTPTSIPTDTPAPSATPVPTETPPPTPTETSVPTETPLPQPTATPIPPPTATPYLPPPPTADLPPAGGDPSSRWIDVNLTTQTVTAFEGDAPVRHFIVSTGLWNTPTVTGQFRIYLRYDSQTMSGPGYYLPNVKWVQYFYQGYALHGTYWHNNFGQPMSHGCVNFTEVEAEWLYQWTDYGTLVNVHY